MPAGTWLVRLHAREIRDGRFHAWIERDDPQQLGRVAEREAWAFPSFFTGELARRQHDGQLARVRAIG